MEIYAKVKTDDCMLFPGGIPETMKIEITGLIVSRNWFEKSLQTLNILLDCMGKFPRK